MTMNAILTSMTDAQEVAADDVVLKWDIESHSKMNGFDLSVNRCFYIGLTVNTIAYHVRAKAYPGSAVCDIRCDDEKLQRVSLIVQAVRDDNWILRMVEVPKELVVSITHDEAERIVTELLRCLGYPDAASQAHDARIRCETEEQRRESEMMAALTIQPAND
eukprot:CAMPEP_0172322324 /NCGR_PEP_ID=MMETSP1058-20130122/45597_1 /TAXON_ID=83371 /ORGANISM="Detonula confervacea, Strain CCMP 353" /LENGTH=161 /DNA_ID=CAMNT_0013038045 /DNA_START=278 /DNA_END=763 /DNA_ORIENTATION=-